MKFGIIGTGTIGSLLTDVLIDSKSAKPRQLAITNRTLSKAEALKKRHPGVKICEDAKTVIRQSTLIFICVKPSDYIPLLQSVRGIWRYEQIAISVTSPITTVQLEQLIPGPVIRVVPSILNQACAGNTLVTFGSRLTDYQKFKVWNLLNRFSRPLEIREEAIRAASDIASCGPAFLSFALERMIHAATEVTPLTKKEAGALVTDTVIGFGKLLAQGSYTLDELRARITVKGGVTGVGLNVLEASDQDVFQTLFQETQKKFVADHQAIDPLFH
ncbi:MAG: late competence protein ComER [Sporolactobacillus sp.]